jgi:2-polyprenyl-6-methoxyphenol hydroxylase-like FAD-dependent oxidoreductase
MQKTRVLILGGGIGGLYAALEFEKRRDPDIEVTLISEENFFLFTPMLHEVAASDLDLTTSSIRFAKYYGTSNSLRGKFGLSIFWLDEWSSHPEARRARSGDSPKYQGERGNTERSAIDRRYAH